VPLHQGIRLVEHRLGGGVTTAIRRKRIRGGTSTEWSAASSTVLKDGEIGLERNTDRLKIGTG